MSGRLEDEELIRVLYALAQRSDLELRMGPGVRGMVTTEFENLTFVEAVTKVMSTQPSALRYKIVESSKLMLVVGKPEDFDALCQDTGDAHESDVVRMEYVLERMPTSKAFEFLEPEYPGVAFRQHPNWNGFIAIGRKQDLLQIKRELITDDPSSETQVPPITESFRLKYADIDKTMSTLSTLSPNVQFSVDRLKNALVVVGPPKEINQIRAWISELDRKSLKERLQP